MSRYVSDDNDSALPPPRPPPHQSPGRRPVGTSMHPDSSFAQLRAARTPQASRRSPDRSSSDEETARADNLSTPQYRAWRRDDAYTNSMASNITPGADNFGEQASGGMAGIALSVADANARESGLEAARGLPRYSSSYDSDQRGYDMEDLSHAHHGHFPRPTYFHEGSQSSLTPLGGAAVPPARTPQPFLDDPYADSPYKRLSGNRHYGLGALDPSNIADDGDEGLEYAQHGKGSGKNTGSQSYKTGPSVVSEGVMAAGGVMGAVGGFVSRNVSGSQPQYNAVRNPEVGYDQYAMDREGEKSEWLDKETTKSNRWRWIVGALIILLVLGVVAAIVVGVLVSRKNNNSTPSSSETAAGDIAANGELTSASPEIQALMGNTNLHKVFPGMDYTPINTQYPACLTFPPSQNNVTRDLAVLSQLTNVVRLYGTDCNQTEMVIEAINNLGLKGTMKVWLGVWQENNATTNARQLAQMYDVLKIYGTSYFKGAIVGNEVLFRADMTEAALATVLTSVKSNFTALGYNLPVATSDLGDKWTASLAATTDLVMANVHPFFSGVNQDQAASWTWDFWQQNNWELKPDLSKNLISETGWPSSGGMDCGGAATCTNGSVAGISGMNTFMDGWVCQALANGTQYFMFEAFDEPWKIVYDTPATATTAAEEWEDKWGLMDVNRNLKSGLVIPSCGGKTVPAA